MIYLANASSPRIRAAMAAGLVGMMATPRERRSPEGVPVWAADNGCFGKGYPGDRAWLAWLEQHAAHADRCLFATAPDVLGDAAATLARSVPFLPAIRALGYPAALVAQNGLTPDAVPWELVDVLFLGGVLECATHGAVLEPRTISRRKPGARGGAHPLRYCPSCDGELSEWKLSAAAEALAAAAQVRGVAVHMGRVNSRARLELARDWGCASADGTFLAFGPDRNLPQVLGWLTPDDDQAVA